MYLELGTKKDNKNTNHTLNSNNNRKTLFKKELLTINKPNLNNNIVKVLKELINNHIKVK